VVRGAFHRITAGGVFTPAQEQWLGRIGEHRVANWTIGREDVEEVPILKAGRSASADRTFDAQQENLLRTLNEAIAAQRGQHG
jgi:type I restriction enzyme, R subunit